MAFKKITLNELRRLVKQVINENQSIDQKENLKWFFLVNGHDELYNKIKKGEADNIEIEKGIKFLKDLLGRDYNPDINYEEEYEVDQYYEKMTDQEYEDYYFFADRRDYAREKVERGEWNEDQAAEYLNNL